MTFQRIPLSDILGADLGQQQTQRESRQSEFSMPILFGDQMILQASVRRPVWGIASPGRKVSVTLEPFPNSALNLVNSVDLPASPFKTE